MNFNRSDKKLGGELKSMLPSWTEEALAAAFWLIVFFGCPLIWLSLESALP